MTIAAAIARSVQTLIILENDCKHYFVMGAGVVVGWSYAETHLCASSAVGRGQSSSERVAVGISGGLS